MRAGSKRVRPIGADASLVRGDVGATSRTITVSPPPPEPTAQVTSAAAARSRFPVKTPTRARKGLRERGRGDLRERQREGEGGQPWTRIHRDVPTHQLRELPSDRQTEAATRRDRS